MFNENILYLPALLRAIEVYTKTTFTDKKQRTLINIPEIRWTKIGTFNVIKSNSIFTSYFINFQEISPDNICLLCIIYTSLYTGSFNFVQVYLFVLPWIVKIPGIILFYLFDSTYRN